MQGFCHIATTLSARTLTSTWSTMGERKQEKEKTDVEDLRPLVVGMWPCRTHRDFQHIATTDGPRTLTSAFSKSKSEIQTLLLDGSHCCSNWDHWCFCWQFPTPQTTLMKWISLVWKSKQSMREVSLDLAAFQLHWNPSWINPLSDCQKSDITNVNIYIKLNYKDYWFIDKNRWKSQNHIMWCSSVDSSSRW